MPICLGLIYGYFPFVAEELRCYNREKMVHEGNCYQDLLRKSLLTPVLANKNKGRL